MPEPDYSPAQVAQLFSEMARTYGMVNLISSLGFSHLWRKAAVQELDLKLDHTCADLMCGMGESSALMLQAAGNDLSITAVDFCAEMTKRCALSLKDRRRAPNVTVFTRDVFDLQKSASYDRICCSFGLKTIDDQQLSRFAALIADLLTASGRASFVEIQVPGSLLRFPYLFYLRHVIPFIGRLCLGDPNCYRHLALFTEDFAARDNFAECLKREGLGVTTRPLFFGCARLYLVRKGEQGNQLRS